MSQLALYLLGLPRVERDGVLIEVETGTTIALLVYLAVIAESQRRASLANLLWPESDHAHRVAALRCTLYALRSVVAGDWQDVDGDEVGLRPGPHVWRDVDPRRRHLSACRSQEHRTTQTVPVYALSLTEAGTLYPGDCLSGFRRGDR